MHWQNMHPHLKKKSRKEVSFSVKLINRKTTDLHHLLSGKAVMFFLGAMKMRQIS